MILAPQHAPNRPGSLAAITVLVLSVSASLRAQYPVTDLPPDHPLFRAQFIMSGVPQIASIGHWFSSGGGTSERGQESAVPHARVITDAHGRIMVLMTHNTDIGDSWEEEASNPQYFYEFSTKGYAFGINAIVYGMTH